MAARRNQPKTIYSKVKRISLYPQHSALAQFFAELDLMPSDIANNALLRAIEVGHQTALIEARLEVKYRQQGLPDGIPSQPRLLRLEMAGGEA